MNQLLLILVITFAVSIEASGQKCKYDFDKKDPMTGDRVRRCEISIKNYFIVNYYRKADTLRVELNVRFLGERNFIVPKGNTIDFKLNDGPILKLASAQDAAPVSYVAANQIMTSFAMTYYCTKEELQKIAEKGFSAVSSKIGDETITYEVKEKDIIRSAEKAKCMLVD